MTSCHLTNLRGDRWSRGCYQLLPCGTIGDNVGDTVGVAGDVVDTAGSVGAAAITAAAMFDTRSPSGLTGRELGPYVT